MSISKDAYLHLLKHTLAFTLWPEPLVPVTHHAGGWLKRGYVEGLRLLASFANMVLAKRPGITTTDRDEGKVWRHYPDTLIGLRRLENIQYCIEHVLTAGVAGDLIETGAWRGGACIFMRGVLAAYEITDRKVFVADSFEGLPPPNEEKYPADKGDEHYKHSFLAVSLEEVQKNFERYNLLDEQIVFLKGWFNETLPLAPIESLSILRLDGDMYGSTMDALNTLYPKLSQGGFCIIDDYHLAGCKEAVDNYRANHGIHEPMRQIDWAGRFWQKQTSS